MAGDTPITVVGNLAADPEIRYTPKGDAVTTVTVMSTPRYFDKAQGTWLDGEPLSLRCQVWREHAENVAESLRKGTRVVVTGRLKQRRFTDRDGNDRTSIEVDADEIAPSLRFATADVRKASRSSSAAPPPADDPWTRPATPAAVQGEPPF